MSKRKLLLADDSITIQKVVNLTFADEGIEVISVGDGDSAMRKFDDFMPDLVMADVNMPGLNGYEMCQIIKNNDETQSIPVILLVGSFEPFDEAEARRVGADDYLTKPFQSIRQLVNKVTDLLNREETVGTPLEAPLPSTEAQGPSVAAFADAEAAVSANGAFDEADSATGVSSESFAAAAAPAEATRTAETENFQIDYGDAGMDDEMIETTSADQYGFEASREYQAAAPETNESGASPDGAENALASWQNDDADPEEDSSAARHIDSEQDIFEAYRGTIGDENESTDAATAETRDAAPPPADFAVADADPAGVAEPHDSAADGRREEDAAPAPEAFYHSSEEESLATQDAQFEQQTNVSPYEYQSFESGRHAAEDEAAQTSFDEPTPPAAATDFDATAAYPAPASEEIRADDRSAEFETVTAESAAEPAVAETPVAEPSEEVNYSDFPIAAADINFEDGDLLELPPLVEETGIRPPVKIEPPPEPPAPEPLPAPAPMLTPEMIEAIAQRVAEKISGQAIQQIASQLAPQVSDLIVQELAREQEEKK